MKIAKDAALGLHFFQNIEQEKTWSIKKYPEPL